MKSHTDLPQSKKLAEILSIESADMCYIPIALSFNCDSEPKLVAFPPKHSSDIPCWSLAALLDYLSANFRVDIKYLDNYWELDCRVQVTYGKELVDACHEMIIKLHELNLI